MPNFATIRRQVENSLESRFAGALSPRARVPPPRLLCSVAPLDEMLHGGLPVGVITELVGPASSGRTTTALAYAAAIVQAGGVCGWIDVSDSFDPESAAASGVDLERLLWVRCGRGRVAESQAVCEAAPEASRVLLSEGAPQPTSGCGSPHPRSEGKGMPHAVGALLAADGGGMQSRRAKRAVGTPGASNRPLTYRAEDRQEQVNSDRMPARRGDNLALEPRCAAPLPRPAPQIVSSVPRMPAPSVVLGAKHVAQKPWSALDQALRATDLLLQAGGFSAIVLDLGSVAPEVAWRIPLATWFRFRAACERTRVSLILLTQHACARSSAEFVIRLHSGAMEADNKVMLGARYQSVVQRDRGHEETQRVVSFRKPPQSVRNGMWRSEAAWAHGK